MEKIEREICFVGSRSSGRKYVASDLKPHAIAVFVTCNILWGQ